MNPLIVLRIINSSSCCVILKLLQISQTFIYDVFDHLSNDLYNISVVLISESKVSMSPEASLEPRTRPTFIIVTENSKDYSTLSMAKIRYI